MTEEERHQIIRAIGLEEKNYQQAAMLMEAYMYLRNWRDNYLWLKNWKASDGKRLNDEEYALTLKKVEEDKLLPRYQFKDVQMTDVEIKEDKDSTPFPKTNLKAISGGRDGDGNWLAGLKEKSVFTCITKSNNDAQVVQFHLMKVWGQSCWLMSNFPAQQQGNFLFHMLKFSQQHDLVDLLQDGEADGVRRQDEREAGTPDISPREDRGTTD